MAAITAEEMVRITHDLGKLPPVRLQRSGLNIA